MDPAAESTEKRGETKLPSADMARIAMSLLGQYRNVDDGSAGSGEKAKVEMAVVKEKANDVGKGPTFLGEADLLGIQITRKDSV